MAADTWTWYLIAEKLADGTWSMAKAAQMTGKSVGTIQGMLAEMAANKAGKQVVSNLARQALIRSVGPTLGESMIAEAAAALGTEAAAASAAAGVEIGAEAAAAGGGAGGAGLGIGLGGWLAIVLIPLLLYGAYKYLPSRNDGKTAVPSSAVNTTLNTPQPQISQTCTRGEGLLTDKGSAIIVDGNVLTYTNPDTGVTNTIGWSPPPSSITTGQEVTLLSWATHNEQPDGIEVQWETKNLWGYGASSGGRSANPEIAKEQSKETKLMYTGGPIKLSGGIRYGGATGKFRIEWNYSCS